MLSKNLNRPRRKPGAVTVAVLSLLLGVQVAALADLQYDYDYGFNRGQQAVAFYGVDNAGQVGFFIGAVCSAHFDPSTSDILACENGGTVAYNQAYAAAHGGRLP